MPSSNTVTAYYTFEPGSLIRSSQVNNNFSNYRGHLLPVDPNTATAIDNTYDLGSETYQWNKSHHNITVMEGQSTPAANPTTGSFKVYMKSNGTMYRLNAAGNEDIVSGLPLTTKGDLAVHDGSATVRLPIGTDAQVLTADSTTASGVKWATVGSTFSYRSVSSAGTATASDQIVVFSGASFSFELPSAAGNTGRVIKFLHNGTSLSQVYTFTTVSGQTINGVASGSWAMHTNDESVDLVSDGTNWMVLNHVAETDWVDAGAVTIGATTTPPTKTNSPTIDKIHWMRSGRQAKFRINFVSSTTSGGAAGTGDYLFTIPSNMTMETTLIIAYTAVAPTTWKMTNVLGSGLVSSSTTDNHIGVVLYDGTKVRFFTAGSGSTAIGSGNFAINAGSDGSAYGVEFECPMAGWQP